MARLIPHTPVIWAPRTHSEPVPAQAGIGTLKGVGRIYQQTYVDTYAKVAQAKLYTTKTPITAADMLNDKVLPFYAEHDLPVLRILTDRGTEYCGRKDKHDFQLFLAINDIDTPEPGPGTRKPPKYSGHLRALSQDHFAGVLSGDIQKEGLSNHRRATGRSR